MLQLKIATQPIRLDYNIKPAQLNLQTTQPLLHMETTQAKVEIRQPRGELTIDQTPFFYSIGLKNNVDFARDNASLSRQSVKKAIARIVQEGYQMAEFNKNSNAIAEIAKNSTRSELPDLMLAHVDAPIIHYQAQPVQFTPVAGKVNFSLERGTVQGDYMPGYVHIQVTQYPSIQMSTVDIKV